MTPFSIGYFAVAFIAVAIGAALGELVRRNAPRQTSLIGMVALFMLGAVIVTGFSPDRVLGDAMSADSYAGLEASIFGSMTRQLAIIGVLVGLQAMLFNQERQRQVMALAVAAIVGVPILTNISFGLGMSMGMQGLV